MSPFMHGRYSRREFSTNLAGAALALSLPRRPTAAAERFALRYVLASCLYGMKPLAEIVPEVAKTGAMHLDIWPRVHGNQREQVDDMGLDRFRALLADHNVRLAIITRYDLGPFKLADEIKVAESLGAKMIVCGGQGPKKATGEELKRAVRDFVERMKPTLEQAGGAGVTIGIENHGANLIESPDSLRWLAEFAQGLPLGIALAPYHLEQDAPQLARLIENLGPALVHFYAWQHGKGAMDKLPKEEELTQLPGRGPLDFRPLVTALAKINYQGLTEIFMHPVPRGIPIRETTAEVTADINTARAYLESTIPM